jgi:hypothetical protein
MKRLSRVRHALDKVGPPLRGIEWIGEIQGLVHDLLASELHDADRVDRFPSYSMTYSVIHRSSRPEMRWIWKVSFAGYISRSAVSFAAPTIRSRDWG